MSAIKGSLNLNKSLNQPDIEDNTVTLNPQASCFVRCGTAQGPELRV